RPNRPDRPHFLQSVTIHHLGFNISPPHTEGGVISLGERGEVGCLYASQTDLPERSARASPGGNLLEFPQPRSCDRGALVSSSFPSRLSLGGYLAPPVMFAKRKGIPVERGDLSKGKGYSAAYAHIRRRIEA